MCYRMRRFEKSAKEKDNLKENQELIFTVDDKSGMLEERSKIKKGSRRTER